MKELKQIIKKYMQRNDILFKIYKILSKYKYKITHLKENARKKKHCVEQCKNACERISEYKNSYVVFFNPEWLGVANSSKGLFENCVPLEQVYSKKCVDNLVHSIILNEIKLVIFSQIVEGWTSIIKAIKELKSDICIKVIWHANNYEVSSDYTWNFNKEIVELYKNKQIDEFAFVKNSMFEFYKRAGFKTQYLTNNVHIERINKREKQKNNRIKVGLYSANSRDIKNIYTQMNAIKAMNNAIADIVPINTEMKEFATLIKLEYQSLADYIKTEELLNRIQDNDINIYITYTECSPMFPIESFEMGIPCLIGNNSDYFQNTKLGEFVIVDKEDDPCYIKDKIEECLKNKEEIMELYKQWKADFDLQCKERVKKFLSN